MADGENALDDDWTDLSSPPPRTRPWKRDIPGQLTVIPPVATLEFCPPGKGMDYTTDSSELMEEWRTINLWAERKYDGLNPEDGWISWKRIEWLLMEGRRLAVRIGAREGNPQYLETAVAFAEETIVDFEMRLERG
jgi:hypothetical protein